MNIIQKLRYKLISLLVGKTPAVFNTEIVDGNLQIKGFGFYKDVYFS